MKNNMNTLNNGNIKLAIQKDGRLTGETLNFLRSSGLEFESYTQRLFSVCRNFPLEILYVRNIDIPDYVASGTVDLGIIGQNLLYEERPKVKKKLNLQNGFCFLAVSCLKESTIQTIADLQNSTIATSYPNSTKTFFRKNNISVNILKISGSVEITPTLGIADAIVDLVSTGSTLALNDLRVLTTIYDSEAVLIANEMSIINNTKQKMIDKLLTRMNGVLSAKDYKYVMMNAPKAILSKITKTIPGLKSPTVSTLITKDWVSIQTVIKEEIFWETIEQLRGLNKITSTMESVV